jgi:hypothetical protein
MNNKLALLGVLCAAAFANNASATVSAQNQSVSPGATGVSSQINYATRAGIGGANFRVDVTDPNNVIVGASVVYQQFDRDAGAAGEFVNCDGNEASPIAGVAISCSQAGVYSARRVAAGQDLPNLNNTMRVLFNVEAGAAAPDTATIGFGPYCTGLQTPAGNGCVAYFDANTTLRDDSPAMPVAIDGTITVSDIPVPRTLSYDPVTGSLITFAAGAAPGTPAPGQTITVTAAGNEGTATLTACSAPAPFNVSPTSLSFADATPGPFNLTVGCSYPTSNATGTLTCTQTNAGAAATQVSWNLSCPAPNVGPTISAVPASGSNVAVSAGSVGTQGQATIDLQAAGGSGGGSTDISCTSTGNVLIAAAPGTPAGQGPVAQTVTGTAQPTDLRVGVVLTAASQPAAGTITCTVSGQADLTWTVSAPAGSTFTPPEVIPSASTWSKIALFGLLGIFGLMAVGFRRQG